MIRIYCKFPDEATALTLAAQLAVANNPSLAVSVDPETGEETPVDYVVETLPPDGVLGGSYYNIQPAPPPVEPSGEVDEEGNQIMVPMPGFYVIGLWRGPEESVPAALSAFFVEPWGAEFG